MSPSLKRRGRLPTLSHILPARFGKLRMNWRFIGLGVLCLFFLPALSLLAINGMGRESITLAIAFPLLALGAIQIRAGIVAVVVYLVLLGDIRRALIPLVGWSGLDPLLLLGFVSAILICALAIVNKQIRLDTPLARWTLALMVVMLLQVFNPKQGGLIVGVAGGIFLIAPLVWFWVGRTFFTEELMRMLLFKILTPLAVAAMLVGFVQVFYGYFPYQMAWYDIAGYTALGTVETGLAPISFFASGTEHGSFLITVGIALWATFLLRNKTSILLLLPLLFGVMLTGSRGPVVKILGMAVVLWALMGRNKAAWVPRGLLALVVCGIGFAWSMSQVGSLGLGGAAQSKLERQALLLDEGTSEGGTIAVHTSLLLHGYEAAFTNPLGYGLGASSKAAVKFGSAFRPTETDIGDVMMTTGLVGGVIYHVMIVLIALTAIRYWLRTRSVLALAFVGILGVNFSLWLGGGLYAVSSILWLCIGALDRLARDSSREETRPHSWPAPSPAS